MTQQLDTGIGTVPGTRIHTWGAAAPASSSLDSGVGSTAVQRSDVFNADADAFRTIVVWNLSIGANGAIPTVPVPLTLFASPIETITTLESRTVSPPA